MKFGVIIPDRGDRPLFYKNCIRMIEAQTIQPDVIITMRDKPLSDACDITYRYRKGYDMLRNQGLDVIFFIENDDWYSPKYFETMLAAWKEHGCPDLFGSVFTMYYHIKMFGYFPMEHYQRCSAMQTMIKPDLNFEWCADDQPYTDSHLWKEVPGITKALFKPKEIICMGIKHGIGKSGGQMHVDRLYRFITNTGKIDKDKSFLRQTLDPASFEFYSTYFEKHSA